ncbi:thioredoxin family protein [Candidimonas humi]|uniref:Thioredoxin family protein n=1 Tax=Candidimonas humi TaxID=683355 RepID=A0ABV8NUS8_9BURK
MQSRLAARSGLVVVCYCAAWCDTCTQYRGDFEQLALRLPQHAFVWVDIEDSPELLGDEDVENFPTLAIQGTEGNRFFGTLLPYIGHLERLIEQLQGDAGHAVVEGPPLLRTLAG